MQQRGSKREGNYHANKVSFRKGERRSIVTEFQPGSIPANSIQQGQRLSPATEFQPGHKLRLRYAVGDIVVRKARNHLRQFVKIAEPNSWKLYAVYVWEQTYGPLAKGHLVHHIDRNTLNDDITNLQALSRAEHLAEHRKDWTSST